MRRAHRATAICAAYVDMTCFPGWQAWVFVTDGTDYLCLCNINGPTDGGNGADDDCDGILDEHAMADCEAQGATGGCDNGHCIL
jgi:hypothetical protein